MLSQAGAQQSIGSRTTEMAVPISVVQHGAFPYNTFTFVINGFKTLLFGYKGDRRTLSEEMSRLNKSELIWTVSERSGLSRKDATRAIETVLQVIAEALREGDKVQLVGFGNFETKQRAARTGRNPQTGEVIQIAPSRIPAFRAGKTLREEIQ